MIEISSGGVCPSNSGPCFRNLAGHQGCDEHIEHELRRAGIPLVHGKRQQGEVPATITGKLGSFTFERAWYYWMVADLIVLSPPVLRFALAMQGRLQTLGAFNWSQEGAERHRWLCGQ